MAMMAVLADAFHCEEEPSLTPVELAFTIMSVLSIDSLSVLLNLPSAVLIFSLPVSLDDIALPVIKGDRSGLRAWCDETYYPVYNC